MFHFRHVPTAWIFIWPHTLFFNLINFSNTEVSDLVTAVRNTTCLKKKEKKKERNTVCLVSERTPKGAPNY